RASQPHDVLVRALARPAKPAAAAAAASVMAGQTVLRRVVLAVTVHAPAHLELLRGQEPRPPDGVGGHVDLVHLLDRPMTGLAGDAGGDVPVVPELHVLRRPVDLRPLDGALLLPVVLELLHAGQVLPEL